MKKYYTGFTLIELLFVMLIAVIMVLMGINQYKKYSADKDITQISYNVSLIFQAANEYFRSNYDATKTPPFVVPSGDFKQAIVAAGLWPALLYKGNRLVPSDNNYTVSIAQLQINNVYTYQFTVKAQFPSTVSSDTLALYKHLLNASDSDSSNHLIWMRRPSYTTDRIDTHLWPMVNQLQQFTNFISGRYQSD